jgi:hypothetical protein
LWTAAQARFARRDVAGAVKLLESKLRARKPKSFPALLEARFQNEPADRWYFDSFAFDR